MSTSFIGPNPFSKGAGDAPDYMGAADKQTRVNRPNQSTPFGSSQWTFDPKTGQSSQTIGLAPGLQGSADSMMGQLGSAWASPLDSGGAARDKAEQAIYGRASSRLDPMWAGREHDMQTQLANQGIDPNSAAYQKASDNFGRNRNDAYSSALMEAIMGGGAEGQRTQQMDLQRRLAPLSALGGLHGLTGMPNAPAGGNYLGAAMAQGNFNMDNAKLQQQFWSDIINAGGKVAAAGA